MGSLVTLKTFTCIFSLAKVVLFYRPELNKKKPVLNCVEHLTSERLPHYF